MSMIPIKKINNPTGSGKCYPLSVFESIVTTGPLTIANDIGGYKRGDVIPAETKFSVIFSKMFEVEGGGTHIVTSFDNVSDTSVPSSKLTHDTLINITALLSNKENVGVAAALISALEQGIIATHTNQITNINATLATKADKSYADTEFNNVKSDISTNSTEIAALKQSKQDKLVWASTPYDENSNKAVTVADISSMAQTLRSEFVKITQFRGVISKQESETDIQAIERVYLEKRWTLTNGDVVFVGKSEYVYCVDDSQWHELGNTDGFIKAGTGSIRNDDFDSAHKISQDYIVGLSDIQTAVTDLTNASTGVPHIKTQILDHESRITSNANKFSSYTPTATLTGSIIPAAIAEANNYTNTEIGKLDKNDSAVDKQFVTSVSESNGIITVNRKTISASDLPVATSNGLGIIKPGNNCSVAADGTLNVSGGSGGIGDVVGPTSSTINHVATFNGTDGKSVKDSGFTIEKSVPSDAKFTDTTYSQGSGITINDNVISHTNSVASKTSVSLVKISYDSNGHITGDAAVSAEDIPALTLAKISDAGELAGKDSISIDEVEGAGDLASKDSLVESDIPNISHTKVTGLGTFATKNSLVASDIPVLTLAKISDAGELAGKDSLDKTDVGLANVDNTSDLNKPISTATQTALNLKEDKTNLKTLAYKDSLTKTDIGLANVDNTSDLNKPVSNATKTAINALKFGSSDAADLTYDDGVIAAVKAILIKLGMSESNIEV